MKSIRIFAVSALLGMGSLSAQAALLGNEGYWVDSWNQIVRNGSGECWHTIKWSSALAVEGCDAVAPKVEAPAPVAKPVAPPPAPAPAPVAAPAPVVVPPPAPVVVAPAPAPAPKADAWKTVLSEKPFRLEGASFATGSSTLLKTANEKLQVVVDAAKQHPEITLEVSGHTDNRGNKAANQKLSQNRANAVKAYLVKQGVAADNITATGYADAQPIADNKTVEGRATNRRVEVKYVIKEEKKVRVTE
ncbi:MAG: OmpA family protein [Sideroxydans sp.]|nr:OmpA family protein [Sideroxydans sp.]